MRILQFFQRNGKFPLPWWKQGNYLVIPIYDAYKVHPFLKCAEGGGMLHPSSIFMRAKF